MQRGRSRAAVAAALVCTGALTTGAIGSAAATTAPRPMVEAAPVHDSMGGSAFPIARRDAAIAAMRLVARSAARGRSLGGASSALALTAATPSTTSVGDAAGDNGPGFDARGDLRAVAVGYDSTIVVGAATETFEDPNSSYNWQAYADGDPTFQIGTGILWGLDVNGDNTADFLAAIVHDGQRLVAGVTNAAGTASLCSATPKLDAAHKAYLVGIAPGCVGSPAKVRAQAFMVYETPTDISEDITAVTPAAARKQTPPPTHPAGAPSGYWMLGADGHVYPFGGAIGFTGLVPGTMAMAPREDGKGYWVVDLAGHVFAYGSARSFGGSPPLAAGEFVSTISATANGAGYWLFTNQGRAFPFGNAASFGDMSGAHLNGPIVASVATPTGRGYYMVGSDGGIFSFGDARFHGSTGGMRLNKPIVGIAPTTDGRGYWLVASDGGVFAFSAPFRGSMGGTQLNQAVDGLVAYGNGYLMVASDGGIFDFSNKPFAGSLADHPPSAPIIGLAAVNS